jgi:Zn-dependent protease
MVVVPLISYFAAGWMMGWASAPYNLSWARQFPRRAALMAIAGPASNLGLVILAGLLLRVGVEWDVFSAPHAISFSQLVTVTGSEAFDLPAKLLSIFFSLNLLLCVFNLLPVPPLDGSAVPLIALPTAAARGYFDLLQSPMLRLVGFLLITRGLGSFFQPILAWAVGLVHPGMRYG